MKSKLLYLLILLSFLFSSCNLFREDSKNAIKDNNITVKAIETSTWKEDNIWRGNLIQWLKISYIEDRNTASFASISTEYLKYPSLYSTFGVVGTLIELNYPIENKEKIHAWIDGLQDEDGSYKDPSSKLPRLVETYWAVRTLRQLNFEPKNIDKILNYVLSNQKEDGLFYDKQNKSDNEFQQSLIDTYYSVKLIQQLNPNLLKVLCDKTEKTLIAYLLQSDQIPEHWTKFLVAIHALSVIEPKSVPPKAKETIVSYINESHDEITKRGGVYYVKEILDVLYLLNIDVPDYSKENLIEYINAKIAEADYSLLNPIDPIMTFELIRAINQLNIRFSFKEGLLKNIARFQLEDGWTTFVTPLSNAYTTFSAITLANQIGFVDFDKSKVKSYFLRILSNDSDNLSLFDAYDSVRGLIELQQGVDKTTSENLKRTSVTRLSFLSETQKKNELFPFVLLSETLEWDITDDLKSEITDWIRSEVLLEDQLSMKDLYQISIAQKLMEVEIYPKNKIIDRLNMLRGGNGYRSSLVSPIADLHSTYLAIEILNINDSINEVKKEDVLDFVSLCKDRFGLNYIPIEQQRENGKNFSFEPDIRVTYEGLSLLFQLENT